MTRDDIIDAASGIGVLNLHPGWAGNRRDGSSVPLSRQGRVGGMLAPLDRYEPNLSGSFFRFDATRTRW